VAVTLVDSNVILDIVTEDAEWLDWSAAMLEEAVERGPVAINPIVYAEVSVGFDTIEAVEEALPRDYFRREHLPWEASFLAAKCFALPPRGGARRSPLPDFFIGAHAASPA
jgi:predicted nucleic acid-binding protein